MRHSPKSRQLIVVVLGSSLCVASQLPCSNKKALFGERTIDSRQADRSAIDSGRRCACFDFFIETRNGL
jgi:hypothetical protein